MTIKKLIIVFCLIFNFCKSFSQELNQTNTTNLILECSRNSGDLPNKQMVVWYPIEFWDIVGSKMKMNEFSINSFRNSLKNYLIFAIVDYTFENGKLTFKSKDEIKETLYLKNSLDQRFYPLNEDEIPPTFIKILNPIMKQMYGQFGDGMQFFLFQKSKISSKNDFDISKNDTFSLGWNNHEIKWKLPFYSVLPLKYCPIDKEEMKGNWIYCPEHGTKLE